MFSRLFSKSVSLFRVRRYNVSVLGAGGGVGQRQIGDNLTTNSGIVNGLTNSCAKGYSDAGSTQFMRKGGLFTGTQMLSRYMSFMAPHGNGADDSSSGDESPAASITEAHTTLADMKPSSFTYDDKTVHAVLDFARMHMDESTVHFSDPHNKAALDILYEKLPDSFRLGKLDTHFGGGIATYGQDIMSVINTQVTSALKVRKNADRANFVDVKKEFYHETQQLEWRTDVEVKTFHQNEGWWLAVDIKPTNDGFCFLPPDQVDLPIKLMRHNERDDFMRIKQAVLSELPNITTFLDGVMGSGGKDLVKVLYSAKGNRLDIEYIDKRRLFTVRFQSRPGHPTDIISEDLWKSLE